MTSKNFTDLRARWLDWLKNDPVQSIWSQIHNMIWDDATFRAVNETRSHTTGTPWLSQNGMIARFVDSSYVAGQSLALARLVDRRADVISLARLVAELREHRTTITRAAYLDIANLPYDYKGGSDAALARMMESAENGVFVSSEPTSGPEAWSVAAMLHRDFDRLSQTSSSHRQPDDCLAESIIVKLENWLNDPAIRRIVQVRHKFVGHAADAKSRSAVKDLPSGLTLNDTAAAHRAVFRVAAVISAKILYDDGHSSPVPTPQTDQFEFWDRGLVPTEKVPELHKFWDAYESERDKWSEGLTEDLLGAPPDNESEN